MGEDLRIFYGGGPMGVTPADRFFKRFGPERVIDTPISESGFIGAGVGAAAAGMRPVVELMFVDFLGVCFDQIYNEAGKLRYMLGSQAKVPLVIRTTIGAGFSFGATHSQTLYSLFVHCPGLKVVVPSTPYDAKGLLKTSIRDDDPVIFCEHKGLYPIKGVVPAEEYTIPLGQADVKREGDDVTVVATAAMVHKALNVAKQLETERISVEVVDPRTLVPFDRKTMLKSIRKTSRLVIVDEDYERCGVASEMAAIAADEAFYDLDAPIKRVTTPTIPIPFNPKLEKALIPDEDRIMAAVKETMSKH